MILLGPFLMVPGHNSPSQLTYGFIGLGHMGRHMASNLLRKSSASATAKTTAGPALTRFVVYDVVPAALARFVSDHKDVSGVRVEQARSPREMADRQCDVIVTMLPNSSHVEEV